MRPALAQRLPRLSAWLLAGTLLSLLAACGTRGNLTLPRTPPPAPVLGGPSVPQPWWNGALPPAAAPAPASSAGASASPAHPNTAKEALPQ